MWFQVALDHHKMCRKLFQLVELGRLCLQIKAENNDLFPGHQVRPCICSAPVWGMGAPSSFLNDPAPWSLGHTWASREITEIRRGHHTPQLGNLNLAENKSSPKNSYSKGIAPEGARTPEASKLVISCFLLDPSLLFCIAENWTSCFLWSLSLVPVVLAPINPFTLLS